MAAPLNNQNAAKPEHERETSVLHITCRPLDKARWVKAANARGMKLAVWVKEILNSRSGQ